MNIIEAASELKDGKKIRRKDWDDRYIRNDMMLYIAHRDFFYIPSERFEFYTNDLLADDWEVVE